MKTIGTMLAHLPLIEGVLVPDITLFDLFSDLIKSNTPPMALSAWGFGSYRLDPSAANDVDVLIVFDDSAGGQIERIKPFCSRLEEMFLLRSGKPLHLQRLTQRECTEVDFIRDTNAVRIWARET
jgi:hypothetical protein